MSWPHLQLGYEIVRGRGVHAASTPPDNITLKRAKAGRSQRSVGFFAVFGSAFASNSLRQQLQFFFGQL
jgi:hypothetical protein